MNILEAEDMVKGLPDQVLFQYAQNPPPQIPQYLAVSEVQRRQDMRQRFQAQQSEQQTIKDQILQGGIAAAGGPPPQMQPPSMAPPMAPPMQGQPPVMAAAGGMMPYTMGNGGSVPAGQENPKVFREFMRRNFATPQGLASNIGLVGGALLGGPIGAGIGGNLGTYIGQKISPAPPPLTDMAMQRILGGGMRAPERTNEGAPPEGAPPEPPPFVDETEGMAVGGMMPSRISDLIDSASTPASSDSQSSLPSTGPSRKTIIRQIKILMNQGRETDAVSLLRQYGISPNEVMMATGGMTPGGIVYMQQGGTAPNDPGANMLTNMLSRVRPAFETIRGILPAPAGISSADLERFKPTREQYFDPEAETRRAELLTRLEQMGTTRKAEDIAAAERYLKEAEAPIKAAQDEARQAAISSTLMRLGAGLAAGKPEEGLAAAAQGVEQTMGRAREVAAAERRAARQDYRSAEREAVRGQRATADQVFTMQAQNLINDENKQREFIRDQNAFAKWAYTTSLEAGARRDAAFNNALQLSIGISKSIDDALQAAIRENRLDQRNYDTIFSSSWKEMLGKTSDFDWGKDEKGKPLDPTPEVMANKIADTVDSILKKRNIVSPASVMTVNTPEELAALNKGDRYRGPDGIVRVKP